MISECKFISELPKGGQKSVYLAEHPTHGKVVVKIGELNSFTSLERIRREVELLTELESEYFPQQFHFNIDIKNKEFQIVEKYIEGNVLREIMTNFRTPKEIFSLISFMINGLSIIWDKNIVHRDLKPENIIIRPNGKPCILDLGIARFLGAESLTQSISPFGPCTPNYAAPEQLTNNKRIIDQRTDFFGLGIIGLELYLGIHPFDPFYVGNEYSIFENILENCFVTETETVKRDDAIIEFTKSTLQTQPYNRFRNYHIFNSFISKQI